MPQGLKQSSGVIVISGSTVETAPNTFKETEIDLQLDVLNQEVFVVTAIDVNMSLPDADATNNETIVRASLSTTSRTSVGTIANSNVFAAGRNVCVSDPALSLPFGVFSDSSTESPHAQLEFIGIIATNNFYAQILGTDNTRVKAMDFRIWGYRARADASVFSALTQSELLSA